MTENEASNKELNALLFTDVICDFSALIAELGVESVMKAMEDHFPGQAKQVYQHIENNKPRAQVAALFKP